MTFTYDLEAAPDLSKVRLLAFDADESNAIFDDAEISAFLGMNSGIVRLAAAQALEVMATSQSMVLKVINNLGLRTDGPMVARDLRDQAKELRRQVADGDGDYEGLFDIAEQVHDRFTERERMWKQRQRLQT